LNCFQFDQKNLKVGQKDLMVRSIVAIGFMIEFFLLWPKNFGCCQNFQPIFKKFNQQFLVTRLGD
jgi:hypothetical protein